MEFDVVHSTGIRYQAGNALSQLPTIGKDCIPIVDTSLVMSVSTPEEHERKGRMNAKLIIDDCHDTSASSTSSGLQAICPFTNLRADTSIPTLSDLLIKKAKHDFCRQLAGKVGTTGSLYSYEHHDTLVCAASLDSAVQTVGPGSLRRHSSIYRIIWKWQDAPASIACTTLWETISTGHIWPTKLTWQSAAAVNLP